MAVWTHIAHESLSLPASEVDWDDISQSYDHLVILISARNSGTSNFLTEAYLRVGDGSVDTTSSYSATRLAAEGSASVASDRETSQSKVRLIQIGNDSVEDDTFSAAEVWIPHYANTANFKQFVIKGSVENTSVSTSSPRAWVVYNVAALWQSTDNITHIKILTSADNFMANSTFDLYGILGV
jgi:hypothetical protein